MKTKNEKRAEAKKNAELVKTKKKTLRDAKLASNQTALNKGGKGKSLVPNTKRK